MILYYIIYYIMRVLFCYQSDMEQGEDQREQQSYDDNYFK